MSRATRELFEQIKAGGDQPVGAVQAAMEGVKEVGGILKEIGGKLWDAMTPIVDHGAHEAAAALFRGDAYIMYPKQPETETPQHGLPEMQQEQDRGGREP